MGVVPHSVTLPYPRRVLHSFTMQLLLGCGACGGKMPVNGIVPEVHCHACGSSRPIAPGLWASLFCVDRLLEAMWFEEGEARPAATFGTPAAEYAYGRCTPRCQQCNGPALDPTDLLSALPSGSVPCGCGNRVSVRAPDDLVRTIHPGARMVVGETFQGGDMDRHRDPVLIRCAGCNAGLSVDGSSRTLRCSYCGGSNYLPDGLWRELNPVPTAQMFFLVCELDDEEYARAVLGSGSFAVDAAQRPDLMPDLQRILARHENEGVRCLLAENPVATPDVLATLADDESLSVRLFVAKHTSTDVEQLRKLARDGDSSLEYLAKKRLAELAAQGVEGASISFWKRLFGRGSGG